MNGNKIGVKERGRGVGEKGVPCKRNTEVCRGLRLSVRPMRGTGR